MIIPKEKADRARRTLTSRSREVEKQYRKGIITDGERYNKIIDIWTHAGDEISNVMFRTLEHNEGARNSTRSSLMVDSGARGNRQQVRQLAGMRGLMAKPCGEIIERPITLELPRRPERARILHLDARRAQRSGRYRAQDRGLRLPHPQTGRCVAGRDHQRRGLRHGQRHLWSARSTKATKKSSISATRIIGRVSCETVADPVEPKKKIVKANQLIDEIKAAAIDKHRRRAAQDSLGAHLRMRARRLRACATGAIWPPASSSSSAKRSASSPRNRSANPARS